jgi:threonine/homoserine/homoserine lactone efflux protein
MVVNLTNPKVILFVLAFIPQFVNPAIGPILPQFLIFGVVIALGGFVVNGLVGVFAGGAGKVLISNPRASRIMGWVTGGIFTALAIRLAIMERA